MAIGAATEDRGWEGLGWGVQARLVVQLIPERLVDDGGERGADAAGLHAFLHHNGVARLLDALADCLHVKGLQADQVDDLHTRYQAQPSTDTPA